MPYATVQEYLDDPQTTPAERKLIKACQAGRGCTLEDGTLPREGNPTRERSIRAALLRVLIIGGTPKCELHSAGITLKGAYITGVLDLRFTKSRGQCTLDDCHFDKKPQLAHAEIARLSLQRSHVPGLSAHCIKIGGNLLFTGMKSEGVIDVTSARIDGQVSCTGANFDGGVDAKGNSQKALFGQGIKVGASLLLGVTAKGTIDVGGAKITGQLSCTGAKLDGGTDANGNSYRALNAQNAEIGADFFLKNMTTKGTIDVNGARVGGQLSCSGASFDGGRDAKGKQQSALSAQRLHVSEGLFFCNLTSILGQVYLDAAHVGDLVDDMKSWPEATNHLYLNGFTYDRIGGGALTLTARQAWLARGSRFDGTFHPQPYTQFAKILRSMGYTAEARKVTMAAQQEASLHQRELDRAKRKLARAIRHVSQKSTRLRRETLSAHSQTCPTPVQDFRNKASAAFKANHQPQSAPPNAPAPLSKTTINLARQDFRNQMAWAAGKARLRIGASWFKDVASRWVIGYGHAPHRAIYAMLAFILPFAVFFHYAYFYGGMVPNSDVILTSPSWWWAMLFSSDTPTLVWDDGGTARHYETFYALAYAFDVFVPLVDLGQQSAWSATTVSKLGFSARIATMALEVIGWIITALAAASVTGLVQKNQPD